MTPTDAALMHDYARAETLRAYAKKRSEIETIIQEMRAESDAAHPTIEMNGRIVLEGEDARTIIGYILQLTELALSFLDEIRDLSSDFSLPDGAKPPPSDC